MNTVPEQNTPAETDLGGGLLLRQSRLEDEERLVEFNNRIHDFVTDHERTIRAMTRDLLHGRCPNVGTGDFTLVVERDSGRIASAMAMIAQTWSYAGIPFGVGRPELVGTDPAFRGRGLVREQFRVFHEQCAARGLPVQVISGIPFFYRQFGYEMATPAGGGRMGFAPQQVPQLAAGAQEACLFRPARQSDLAWIEACYHAGCGRYLLSCVRDAALWQYELSVKDEFNIHKKEIWVITTPGGSPAGFLVCHKAFAAQTEKVAIVYELLHGFSWRELTPAVLRFLWQRGQADAAAFGGVCAGVGLELGGSHPAYAVVQHWLTEVMQPGAWFTRVADIPAFIQQVAPVLQQRLNAAGFSTWEGELRLSLYASVARLRIQGGLIQSVEAYRPKNWEEADAAFPYLSFLQLLFGFRSLHDLMFAYPDCWCHGDKTDLVSALFPILPSNVWGVA